MLRDFYENWPLWGGGGEGMGKNLAWLEIYSIVPKGHKENPEQVNGDYLSNVYNWATLALFNRLSVLLVQATLTPLNNVATIYQSA